MKNELTKEEKNLKAILFRQLCGKWKMMIEFYGEIIDKEKGFNEQKYTCAWDAFHQIEALLEFGGIALGIEKYPLWKRAFYYITTGRCS